VIIYSMGKSGTTSLTVALREAGFPVVKVHSLTKAATAERIWAHERSFSPARPRVYWRYDYLRRDLRARPWVRRRMISVMREPVARMISAYFYDLDPARYGDPLDAHGAGVQELIELEIERDWFATELEAVTGIDVYGAPFEREAGAQHLEHGRFDVLLLRQEDLRAESTPTVLAGFLGAPRPIDIPRRNAGEDSSYADLQRRFVSDWVFPAPLLERAYATRPAQHFYSDDERARFLARWSSPRTPAADAGREPSR